MVEVSDGHIYLKTTDSYEKVGEAIAEEFSNWSYNKEDNKIYQRDDNRKHYLILTAILFITGGIMLFIYLPAGVVLLIGLILIFLIWGEPKDIQEPIDFITIYELYSKPQPDELPYRTHINITIFDDEGERNLTNEDITSISERIGTA